MGSTLQHVAVFLSLAVFVVAFALAISGFTTDYWIDTAAIKRNNTVSALSFVHSGLFYGERQFDYGQEIKLEPLSGELFFVSPDLSKLATKSLLFPNARCLRALILFFSVCRDTQGCQLF